MAIIMIFKWRLFLEKFFQALEMLLDIKAAFDEMVAELDWMDSTTRARAHKKLQAIRPFVAFPEWIKNPDKLNKLYDGVGCTWFLFRVDA